MEWRGRGPCPDAVRLLSAVFGAASRIPRVPPASDGIASERLLAWMSYGSCLSLGRFADIPVPAPPDGAVGALTGFRCELWRGSARRSWRAFGASRGVVPFGGRGGPDTETGPPDMKKSAAPSVGSGAFVLHFTGRGGQSGLSAAVRSGEVALPVGLGFRCGPRVAGPFSGRVGPRHGDGTAVHEKSAAPDVESGAFALCFAGLGLAQTVIISFSLRSRTPSSSLVNFSSSFCVCVSPSFDSSSGMPSF